MKRKKEKKEKRKKGKKEKRKKEKRKKEKNNYFTSKVNKTPFSELTKSAEMACSWKESDPGTIP